MEMRIKSTRADDATEKDDLEWGVSRHDEPIPMAMDPRHQMETSRDLAFYNGVWCYFPCSHTDNHSWLGEGILHRPSRSIGIPRHQLFHKRRACGWQSFQRWSKELQHCIWGHALPIARIAPLDLPAWCQDGSLHWSNVLIRDPLIDGREFTTCRTQCAVFKAHYQLLSREPADPSRHLLP